MIEALRSFEELMIGEDRARPRCVAASKQTVSIAPRMMLAVTGSMLAEVGSGPRLAGSFRFSSNDMAGSSFAFLANADAGSDLQPAWSALASAAKSDGAGPS